MGNCSRGYHCRGAFRSRHLRCLQLHGQQGSRLFRSGSDWLEHEQRGNHVNEVLQPGRHAGESGRGQRDNRPERDNAHRPSGDAEHGRVLGNALDGCSRIRHADARNGLHGKGERELHGHERELRVHDLGHPDRKNCLSSLNFWGTQVPPYFFSFHAPQRKQAPISLIIINAAGVLLPVISMNSRKGQAALDFLMTYGWAIALVVIIAAVLFALGIFDVSNFTGSRAAGFSGVAVKGWNMNSAVTMTLKFANQVGQRISIDTVNVTIGNTSIVTALPAGPLNTGQTSETLSTVSNFGT